MTKKNYEELIVAPTLAARYIAGKLGLTPELWQHRLSNWRRPGRTGPLQAITTEGGNPGYHFMDVEAFIATQQAVQSTENGVVPRPGAIAQIDGPERPHVRVSFATGAVTQSVFAIDQRSARKLAKMLNKAADLVDKAAGVNGDEAAA